MTTIRPKICRLDHLVHPRDPLYLLSAPQKQASCIFVIFSLVSSRIQHRADRCLGAGSMQVYALEMHWTWRFSSPLISQLVSSFGALFQGRVVVIVRIYGRAGTVPMQGFTGCISGTQYGKAMR